MPDTSAKQTLAQQQCLSCKQQFDLTHELTKCPHCELILTPVLTDPLINLTLDGQYKIVEELGQGAVSKVYRGLHLSLNTPVAIKVLKNTREITSKQLQRFEIEGKAVRSLPNNNIARVYDYGVSPEPYIIMEYINGKTLAKTIADQGAMPFEKAIPLFITIAEAIEQAHKAGLIHRDLKPANIMIEAKSGEPKILDFGLVKGFTENAKLTATGEMVGSPVYMSPEQCRGDQIDPRSDIYSLGCMMFETLTGQVPFDGGSTIEVMFKHLEGEIPEMQKMRPSMQCPPGLQQVINRALAKSADDRYSNMTALCQDLKLVMSGKGKRISNAPRKDQKHKKILRLVGAAAAALLVGIVAVVGMFFSFLNQTRGVANVPPPLKAANLQEGMAAYSDVYCLKPDARFVTALSDIAKFTSKTAGDGPAVKPVLKTDGWHFLLDDKDVGVIPRQAGYKDMSRILDNFAKQRVSSAGLKPGARTFAPSSRLGVSALMDEENQLEGAFSANGLTGKLAAAIARNLAWLSFVGYDTMEGFDKLQGRALAMCTIAKQLNQNMLDVETILARDMGYGEAAKSAASAIPTTSAVRAYIENNRELLKQLSASKEPLSEERYLSLLLETSRGEESEILGAMPAQIWKATEDQDLALAKLDMRAKNNFWHAILAKQIMMDSVINALGESNRGRQGGGDGNYASNMRDFLDQVKEDNAGVRDVEPAMVKMPQTGQQIATFEKSLAETATRASKNKILSADLIQQYYRAFFYSAIYDIANTIEYDYAEPGTLQQFAESMSSHKGKTDTAGELRSLISLGSSRPDPSVYAPIISSYSAVKGPVLWNAYDHMRQIDPWRVHEYNQSRLLAQRIDNRPTNLAKMAELMRFTLKDAYWTELTYNQLAKESSDIDAKCWVAARNGNTDFLKTLLTNESYSAADRLRALDYLQWVKKTDEATKLQYLEQIASESGSSAATIRLAEALCDQKQPEKAASMMETWSKRHPTAPALEQVTAQATLAKCLMKAGHTKPALAKAKAAAESMKLDAVMTYANLLNESGDINRAYEQYEAGYRRYGSTEPFAKMLGIKWKLNKPEEAADLIAHQHSDYYQPDDWEMLIAAEFMNAYKDRPTDQIVSAFEKIRGGQSFWWGFFEGIPLAYMHHNDYKNGFALISLMGSSSQKQDCRYKILAYQCLKKFKTDKEAKAWLIESLKSRDSYKDPVWWAISANTYKEYDLLWDLIPVNFEGRNAPTIWDLRAEAETVRPGTAGKYRRILETAVERTPDCFVGRSYFGDITEKKLMLIDVANNPKLARRLCIARGLKSRVEHNYVDAAKWYSLAHHMSPQDRDRDFRDANMDPAIKFCESYLNAPKTLARLSDDDFKHEFD